MGGGGGAMWREVRGPPVVGAAMAMALRPPSGSWAGPWRAPRARVAASALAPGAAGMAQMEGKFDYARAVQPTMGGEVAVIALG